jgi:REP element-mobilizing transposase RayT
MPNYQRADVAGGTYFFTVNTLCRLPVLTEAPVRAALREAIRCTRAMHPFDIDAWVLLPDTCIASGRCRKAMPTFRSDGRRSSAMCRRNAARRSVHRIYLNLEANGVKQDCGNGVSGNIKFVTTWILRGMSITSTGIL